MCACPRRGGCDGQSIGTAGRVQTAKLHVLHAGEVGELAADALEAAHHAPALHRRWCRRRPVRSGGSCRDRVTHGRARRERHGVEEKPRHENGADTSRNGGPLHACVELHRHAPAKAAQCRALVDLANRPTTPARRSVLSNLHTLEHAFSCCAGDAPDLDVACVYGTERRVRRAPAPATVGQLGRGRGGDGIHRCGSRALAEARKRQAQARVPSRAAHDQAAGGTGPAPGALGPTIAAKPSQSDPLGSSATDASRRDVDDVVASRKARLPADLQRRRRPGRRGRDDQRGHQREERCD